MNHARLDELHAEVGEDAFDEVLTLFLQETDEVAAKLRDRPDPATLYTDLHFMKGAALNLGLDVLAQACDTAERSVHDGRAGAVDIDSILATYQAERASFCQVAPARQKAVG